MRAPKRYPKATPACSRPTTTLTDILKTRLASAASGETVDYSAFLAEERAKQAAGKLRNPDATGPLLERLETAIKAHSLSSRHRVGAQ